MLCNEINLVPTGLEHTYTQPAALFKHNLGKGSMLPQILTFPAAMMGNQMSPTLVMFDTTDFFSDPILSNIQASICDTDSIPLDISVSITTPHKDKLWSHFKEDNFTLKCLLCTWLDCLLQSVCLLSVFNLKYFYDITLTNQCCYRILHNSFTTYSFTTYPTKGCRGGGPFPW